VTVTLTDTPVLETERLILRAPQAGDWPAWRDFALTERAQFVGGPYALGTAWRAFGHVVGMWVLRGFGSFVFTEKVSGTPIGLTGPWYPEDWPEPELGWTVWSPEVEGKGLAHEAASAARDYAYRSLGWDTAVSYIHRDNARSIALAKRLGATLDDSAPAPHEDDLVFRHPAPGALV